MQKHFLLACLLCLAGTMIGQTTFDWGISLYPNVSNRRLIAFSNISDREIIRLDSLESGRFSYSAGLNAGWRGGKVGFYFGLNYMDTGYKTLKGGFAIDEPNPREASNRRFVYKNTNLEVPVELKFYQELKDGSHFYFMLGGAMSINLQNNFNTILYFGDSQELERTKDEREFRSTNFAFQTGMGWEKALSDKIILAVQPTFQFWTKGVLVDNELNRNLYSFGLKLIVNYRSFPLE